MYFLEIADVGVFNILIHWRFEIFEILKILEIEDMGDIVFYILYIVDIFEIFENFEIADRFWRLQLLNVF